MKRTYSKTQHQLIKTDDEIRNSLPFKDSMMPSCVGCDVKVVGTMGQVFAKRIAFLQERKELLLKRLGVERMERERVWAMLDEKVPQIASVSEIWPSWMQPMTIDQRLYKRELSEL